MPEHPHSHPTSNESARQGPPVQNNFRHPPAAPPGLKLVPPVQNESNPARYTQPYPIIATPIHPLPYLPVLFGYLNLVIGPCLFLVSWLFGLFLYLGYFIILLKIKLTTLTTRAPRNAERKLSMEKDRSKIRASHAVKYSIAPLMTRVNKPSVIT